MERLGNVGDRSAWCEIHKESIKNDVGGNTKFVVAVHLQSHAKETNRIPGLADQLA